MTTAYNPSVVTDGLILCLDGGNLKSYPPYTPSSVFPYPTDIYSFVTTAAAATLSRDTISSPVGNTPLKMVVSGDGSYTFSYNSAPYNLYPALAGDVWVVSVYVKANTATRGGIYIFGADSSGGAFTGGDILFEGFDITTEWKRVTVAKKLTSSVARNVQVRFDGPLSDSAGITLWWDGAEVYKLPTDQWTNLCGPGPNMTLINGAGYVNENGGIITFDGINEYATNGAVNGTEFTLANSLMADANGAWTVSAWFRFPTSPSGTRTGNQSWSIVGRAGGIATSGTFVLFVGSATDTTYGSYAPYYCASVIRGAVTVISPTSVNDDLWHNVAVSWDGTNGYAYFDGRSRGALSIGTAAVQSQALNIGRASTNTSHLFEGAIPTVSIYNRALSATEVAQNFNALRGRFGI